MGKRREGREAAVQFLYQRDLNAEPEQAGTGHFWELRVGAEEKTGSMKMRAFTEQLVAGVMQHREEIDRKIQEYAANYDLHRIAAVDRNVLRLAIFEMLHCPDIAPVVAINEAIEIAKKFGTEKSGGFVNGILDRVKKELGRPAREALVQHRPLSSQS